MVNERSSSAVIKYCLQMMKPRLVLVALLVFYEQTYQATGLVHPHVAPSGQIFLQSSAGGNLIDPFSVDNTGDSEREEIPGPFFGDLEVVPPLPQTQISVRKRECDLPSVATRGLLGQNVKRSYFASSSEEMKRKVQEQDLMDHQIKKRETTTEGILPWTCETKYEWRDMGADHYPRFVRTAECKSKVCVRGFFRCKPRRYKTKILKRISGPESSSCEEDDVSLPETLRSNWRFITVTINLCCDCTGPGRLPAGGDV
ncbi:unnamed protein product [Allacma fusca]|uniref:Protein trunk n=1 Tax=Allacma fusca TaxID=39272 RepID=A0A8J2P5D4_9HEXA|nr:unnamed protein product [Allacma fusca]